MSSLLGFVSGLMIGIIVSIIIFRAYLNGSKAGSLELQNDVENGVFVVAKFDIPLEKMNRKRTAVFDIKDNTSELHMENIDIPKR